jgi:hypothetical protein
MPTFTVLRRQDAYVDYLAEIEADTPQAAADLACEADGIVWEERGVTEFDANRVVTLDGDGEEIESTARGKG